MSDRLANVAVRNPDAGDLHYVGGGPRFNLGANVAPNDLGDPMSWKTPKIVEVPVGMEINMYACAARK